MKSYIVEYIACGALFFSAGIYIYIVSSKLIERKIFSFFCFAVSAWQLGFGIVFLANSENQALLGVRVIWSGVIFIPTFFYHFTIVFLDKRNKSIRNGINYLLSIFFLLSLWLTNWFIKGSYHYFWGYYGKAGFLQYLYMLFFVLTFGTAWHYWYKSYKEMKHKSFVEYSRRKHIFLMAGVGLIGGADFLPNYGIGIYPFAAIPVTIAFGFVGHAIIKHQLMDIRTVIHKTVMWLTTSGSALLAVLFTVLWARPWITNLNDLQFSALVAFCFLLLVFYIKTVQPRIDHLFQRRKYDMQKILQGMVKELTLLKDLKGLTEKIVSTIQEALYVSHSSIVLWDVKKSQYAYVGNESTQIDFRAHAPFLTWMQKEDRVIESMEIEADPRHENVKASAHRYFEAFSAKVTLPLIHDQKLIGIINLGEKDNLKPFTRSDIEFLSNLRIEASIALSNSLLYDDVQKMSETLRQWALDLERKVEERTHELSESKAELERSYQKLQELDQVKTQFFANISHELRTPLTLILAPLESILHRDTLQGDLREDVNSMYQNGLRLLKLINNLLDMAKIDAGKMQLSYIKTDFIKFVKGIIASVSPMAEKKEISLSFSGPDQLSEFYFDRDKLEKVLLNIIFNSLKFTNPRGRVDVSCERRDDHVIVRVSDTGIGIAQENIHKLFNRFSQVDASSSRRFEGTGIGLALSKELIELHNGEIWAESELGKGTAMNFTIPYLINPICIPEQKEVGAMDWTRSLHKAAEYATAGVVQETQPMQNTALRRMPAGAPKILVVEDNPDMLHFLVTQLQEDYQVITAQNGVEGVERAQTDLPNLILSDVMMPIKDGYQLCREVKENALTKHIPIVLISAKADLSMKIEGLEYGADDYLTKPFSCEELRARIKSLLNQRTLEAQLIHSEKMAALGLLVAGMAHEINNPINFAKMSLENLSKALTEHNRLMKEGAALDSPEVKRLDDKINRAFSIIATGLDRTEAIISDLKAFVRKDEAQFRPTDLHAGLDSTLNLLGPELKGRITISKEYGEIELIEAVPGQINQVFMNLLQNAIHAIPGEGEIRIKTWKEEEHIKISVRDNGGGISPEHQKRIFEPFFTTKEVGKGTGLGLSVSYRIIQSHNGQISVISQPGQGAEFVITLPVKQTLIATHHNR